MADIIPFPSKSKDELVWTCSCGSEGFFLCPDYAECGKCGKEHPYHIIFDCF